MTDEKDELGRDQEDPAIRAILRLEGASKRAQKVTRLSILAFGVAVLGSATLFVTTSMRLREEQTRLQADYRELTREKADVELQKRKVAGERDKLAKEVAVLEKRRKEHAARIAEYIADKSPSAPDLALLVESPAKKETSAPSLWANGYKAFREGDLKKAKDLYLQAREVNPKYAPALNSLGVIALRDRDAEAAIDLFQKAMKFGSETAIANLGHAYLLAHNEADAMIQCERANRLHPDSDVTRSLKAKLAEYDLPCTTLAAAERLRRKAENENAAGRVEPAIQLFRRSCDIDSTSQSCRRLEKLCVDNPSSPACSRRAAP
jgi:tetratricopeptide (TPR) repeat protein